MHLNSKLVLSLLVAIPSTLAAVNGKCTGRNGICISSANCKKFSGKSYTGKCPKDPNDIKCCDDITCEADDGRLGSCMYTNQCNTKSKELISGKCPGGNDFKCCVDKKPPEIDCAYDGLKGKCQNVDNCKGFRIAHLCPGSDSYQCCLPINKCKNNGVEGKCIPTSQCNKKTHYTVSGKCPGGGTIKCCLPNPSCVTPNHSTIAAAAVAYAWETKNKGRSNNGTQLYRAVKDAIFPGDPYYQSCDRGVATAIRWSGADDNFPDGGPNYQDEYLKAHSNLWTFIGKYDDNYSKLKPGDIVITTTGRRISNRNHGHIVLFVGNGEVRKKYPNSDAEFVSASRDDRSPGCGDHPSNYRSDGYHIYRYRGNYSGSMKNAYTGCASGTS